MFSCLLQILQLKYKIEEEIQKNNTLKKQLMSLQEDIDRTVSIKIKSHYLPLKSYCYCTFLQHIMLVPLCIVYSSLGKTCNCHDEYLNLTRAVHATIYKLFWKSASSLWHTLYVNHRAVMVKQKFPT